MITLRLSDESYRAVKHYAAAEHKSMNSWIEALLGAEDMRRRCAAHEQWISANPQLSAAAAAFGAANRDALAQHGVPHLGE